MADMDERKEWRIGMANIIELLEKEQMNDFVVAHDGENKLLTVISACNKIVADKSDYLSAMEKNLFDMFAHEVQRLISKKRCEMDTFHKAEQRQVKIIEGHKNDVLREVKLYPRTSAIVNGHKIL